MSGPSCFRCPHCEGLIEAAGVIAGHVAASNGSLRSGRAKEEVQSRVQRRPDPGPDEVVRNAQVQPAPAPSRKRHAQLLAQGEENRQERAQDRIVSGMATGKLCSKHGKAKPSRFGGLFCPTPDSGSKTGWCSWRPDREAA